MNPRLCLTVLMTASSWAAAGATLKSAGPGNYRDVIPTLVAGDTLVLEAGLYLGNSNGEAPFIRGLIEHNLVHDPVGYCMEIKYQKPRPELPGMPDSASRTIIRHNVFLKNDRPSPDGDRPNVLVGGFPDRGPGAEDAYEIYGNFFHHNPRESLLQASGRVTIHDNVFAGCPDAGHAAITLRDHDLPLKLAHVYHNTIVAAARGIRIASPAAGGHAVIGNVTFADQPLVPAATSAGRRHHQ